MNPFVDSQVSNIVECIRLLEAFVTAPLGLYSDIKMLRESLPVPEAGDLQRSEVQERRIAYKALTDSPARAALSTIELVYASLEILEGVKEDGGLPVSRDWRSQARRVLTRAEQKVAGELRAETAAKVRGLYVIVDPQATRGRPVREVAEAALRGGASVIQLRDKNGSKGQVLSEGLRLKSICDAHGALFIMNDDSGLALSSGAHGLHLGQEDMPVPEARRVAGQERIIGRSNNSVEEVVQSQAAGVDYIAVGAVFPTTTMGKADRPAVGVETLEKVRGMVDQPVVAIGGISESNAAEVVRAGADCVCVVSAVTLADDPEAAARRLAQATGDAA